MICFYYQCKDEKDLLNKSREIWQHIWEQVCKELSINRFTLDTCITKSYVEIVNLVATGNVTCKRVTYTKI